MDLTAAPLARAALSIWETVKALASGQSAAAGGFQGLFKPAQFPMLAARDTEGPWHAESITAA